MMKTLLSIFLLVLVSAVQAESKKVNVFEKSQQFWDVQTGQTLGGICQSIQATSKNAQVECQKQILKDNPGAFINNDPNQLLAGKRLWLPGSYQPVSQQGSQKYNIKKFNWGSIKTPK